MSQPKPSGLSVTALAQKLGVARKTVTRWKADGAPIHDVKKLMSWVSSRKNIPKAIIDAPQVPSKGKAGKQSKKTEAAKPSAKVGGVAGAAQALKRLETAELAAFEKMEEGIKNGDGPLMLREHRDTWLKISESLRKFDLLVEQNRREAGDLIPRELCETAMKSFCASSWIGFMQMRDTLVTKLEGTKEPYEIGLILEKAFGGLWLASCLQIFPMDKGVRETVEKVIKSYFNIGQVEIERRREAVQKVLAQFDFNESVG